MAWFGSIAMDSVVLFGVVTVAIYLFFRHRYTFWEKQGIRSLPPVIPFGNCKDIFLWKKSIPDVFADLYFGLKKTGVKYGGIYFATQKILYPLDPEVIKDIMTKDFQYFTDRGLLYDEKNEPLSANLFNLDGHKWKNLRNKLTPTFTSGKMKMMFPTLVSCGDELKAVTDDYVAKAEPVDIKELLARYTTDIIGSCAFGIECNSLKEPDNDFRKYGKLVFAPPKLEIMQRLVADSLPSYLRDLLQIKTLNSEVAKFYTNIVSSTVDYREKNNVQRNDFMHLLLQMKENGNGKNASSENGHVSTTQKLTFDEIAAQCFVFFLAGFETSSTTMTFCLYELAKHPDIQEKLRQEILEHLKKDNGKLTYDSIMHMTYLDQVVSEALRKYPPLSILMRRCTRTYTIPGSDHVIHPGMKVFIPAVGLHMDPEYYPDPEKFDPARFTEEEKSKRHPYTYLPFGEGPRNCIGLRFGLMQTKVGISLLLSNYKLTVNPRTSDPLVFSRNTLVVSAEGNIWLDVKKL